MATNDSPGLPESVILAERAVLATMLFSSEDCHTAAALLKPRSFFLVAHRKMFSALLAITARGENPGTIVLIAELERAKQLDLCGGINAIAGIAQSVGTPANLSANAHIVQEAATRRRIRRASLEVQALTDDPAAPNADALARLQSAATELADSAAAPGGHAAERIEFLDLEAIQASGIPPVPWIVDGWLAEEDIALISGDGGIGKSTTVAALAIAVATGGIWCGLPVKRSGHVLVLDEEQSVREVSRLCLRLGAPHDNLHVACQQGVNLTSAMGLKRIETALAEHRPILTVFDSVQQVFAGVDGNNAGEVAAVYAELFRLRREYGTAFTLIGHLRKPPPDGQTSKLHLVHGSVAFGTQASTVWVATQPAKNLLDLFQVKRRDGERTSLRIRYQTEGPNESITLTGEGEIEEQETITERAQDFIVSFLSSHGISPTGWIVQAGAVEQPAIPERTVKRALKHLTGLGSVQRVKRGYFGLAQARDSE